MQWFLRRVEELEEEVSRLRRVLERVDAVTRQGPRFTDRHMESAADTVVEEVREALGVQS